MPGRLVDVGRTGQEWAAVAGTMIFALPLAGLLIAGLVAARRLSGRTGRLAWWRSAAEVGMVVGTLPWVWLILTPGPGPRQVFLVPLTDLANQLHEGIDFAAVQIGGNLLVFAALGFLAPIRFAALTSLPRVLMLGGLASIVVEVLQYVLDLDRVTSVDDVLVNAVGAALAALASRRWWASGTTRVRHS